MIRNKSSVFEASALKCIMCLCYSSFSEFHDSKHWYSWILDDRYLWIVPPFEWLCRVPFSFRCVWLKSSIPLLFVSRTEERPVSLRESLRVFLDFSEFETQIPSFPFLVQSMSLNIDMKMISGLWIFQVQCFVLANHSGFSEESAMTKILENIPLEFNWFSIDSQQFFVKSGHFELSLHLTFPSTSIASLLSYIFVQMCFHVAHGIWVYTYNFCFCPLDHLIMRQCRSRPWGRCAFNWYSHSESLQNGPISISVWYCL